MSEISWMSVVSVLECLIGRGGGELVERAVSVPAMAGAETQLESK